MHHDLFTRKRDSGFFKGFLHSYKNLLANGKLFTRFGHEFATHHHAVVIHLSYSLRLERLQKIRADYRIFQHFCTDFLKDFPDLVNVSIKRHTKAQLQNSPVAAKVGDLRNFTIGYCMHQSLVMTQSQGAQGNLFYRTLSATYIYSFAYPKRIIGQKEQA